MYIILSSEVMVHLAPCSADTTDQGNKVSCAAKNKASRVCCSEGIMGFLQVATGSEMGTEPIRPTECALLY